MAGYIAGIILATALCAIALVRWRSTAFFWSIIVFSVTMTGWALFKLFNEAQVEGYWLVEWIKLFGLYLSLHVFLYKYGQKSTWLAFTIFALFLCWLVILLVEFDSVSHVINPAFVGLIVLLMLQTIEGAGNRLPETFRAEIIPLSGSFSLFLIWELVTVFILILQIPIEWQSLDFSKALVACLFIVLGIIYVLKMSKGNLTLSGVQQSVRPSSSLNVFAIYCWVGVIGYKFVEQFEPQKWLINAYILLSIVVFVLLAYRRKFLSQLKILATKLLSSYKYDYRQSWLGFNRALDEANVEGDFYQLSIKALANIVNCSGGKLWSCRGDRFIYIDNWMSPLVEERGFQLPSTLVKYIEQTNWVVDIEEYIDHQALYEGLKIDLNQSIYQSTKIFVPLRRGEELVAIVGLTKSYSKQSLNWEDHDLLKASGQQMASYLALFEATRQIYEQEKFDAFNRLSAFVVHDLKNVAAQLELITHNSNKFRHNDEFIDDSFETVASATERLNKMLKQLQRKQHAGRDLKYASIIQVHEFLLANSKKVTLQGGVPAVQVIADTEQLINIIQHLHQNALEASSEQSEITHKIEVIEEELYWHIIDQGKGMSPEFIRKQLFKPFATTKGNAGMGIGVYQCRYLLQSFGGDLIIQSELGKGTHCIVILQIIPEQ